MILRRFRDIRNIHDFGPFVFASCLFVVVVVVVFFAVFLKQKT